MRVFLVLLLLVAVIAASPIVKRQNGGSDEDHWRHGRRGDRQPENRNSDRNRNSNVRNRDYDNDDDDGDDHRRPSSNTRNGDRNNGGRDSDRNRNSNQNGNRDGNRASGNDRERSDRNRGQGNNNGGRRNNFDRDDQSWEHSWEAGSGRGYKGHRGRRPDHEIRGSFSGEDGRDFSITDDERDQLFSAIEDKDYDELLEFREQNPEIFDILAEGSSQEREDLLQYLGGEDAVEEAGSTDPLDMMSWMGGGTDVSNWDILGIFSGKSENVGGTAGVIDTENTGLFSGLLGSSSSGGGLSSLTDSFGGITSLLG